MSIIPDVLPGTFIRKIADGRDPWPIGTILKVTQLPIWKDRPDDYLVRARGDSNGFFMYRKQMSILSPAEQVAQSLIWSS